MLTEKHGLENDRTKLIKKMRKLYAFLETDFDYSYTIQKETDKYPGGPNITSTDTQTIKHNDKLKLHCIATVLLYTFT